MISERSQVLKKSFVEFVVIIAGVMVALAADRWVKGIDARADQSYYVDGLIDNLAADSARFAANTTRAATAGSNALDLLLFIENGSIPTGINDTVFVRNLGLMSYYTPTDFSRETWDELVNSGRIGLISDPGMRKRLSTYYNGLDRLATVERDWETQLGQFESALWSVQSPVDRLALSSNPILPDSIRARHQLGKAELARIRSKLLQDKELPTLIGQAIIIRSTAKKRYAAYGAAADSVLEALRAYAR